MKKRIKIIVLLITLVFFITGCSSNYSEIPYNKFINTFKNEKNFKMINNTSINRGIYEKSYEIGNKKITFYYLEFKSSKEAENYVNLSYKNNNFHYKKKDNYIIATRKISKLYIKAVKVGKIVVIGISEDFFDRFKVNKFFKKMGL